MSSIAPPHFSPEYLAANRGREIIVDNAVITGFAALIVIARIVSRLSLVKKLGMDDWSILVATILAVANIVVAGQSVRLGTGKHIQAVPKANVIPAGIYRFVTRVVYFLITGTIKLSVCFLYIRVFPTINRATYTLMAVIILATIAQELCTIFQCVPVAGVWNTMKYPHAKCINNLAFSYSASAISAVTDIWAWLLPIPTVWALHIPKRRKYTLIGLFSVGLLAVIAGIIRMCFMITLMKSTDPTWDTFGLSMASGWETALSIITASAPGLKPLFDRAFPKFFPTTKTDTSTTPNSKTYELQTTRKSRGFTSLGTQKEEDTESTTAITQGSSIKVNFEYNVRSDVMGASEHA